MLEAVRKAGDDAHIVVVNKEDAAEQVQDLTSVTKVPVHQDTAAVLAWGKHGIAKDDMIVYDSEGKLVTFLPINGTLKTNLSTDDGFAAVVSALQQAK